MPSLFCFFIRFAGRKDSWLALYEEKCFKWHEIYELSENKELYFVFKFVLQEFRWCTSKLIMTRIPWIPFAHRIGGVHHGVGVLAVTLEFCLLFWRYGSKMSRHRNYRNLDFEEGKFCWNVKVDYITDYLPFWQV